MIRPESPRRTDAMAEADCVLMEFSFHANLRVGADISGIRRPCTETAESPKAIFSALWGIFNR
jgi:hypothetical protein